MSETAEAPVLFDAVLRPNRSASVGGINLVVALVAAACATSGTVFAIVGAWPVSGFLGLDVLLLYLALRLNHRAGHAFEAIRLTERSLTVRRVDPWGRRRDWSFQPHWLQVVVDEAPADAGLLVLRSHGRELSVGAFLTAEERLALAGNLRRALADLSIPRRAAFAVT